MFRHSDTDADTDPSKRQRCHWRCCLVRTHRSFCLFIITDRIRMMREGNVFSLSTPRGVPWLGPDGGTPRPGPDRGVSRVPPWPGPDVGYHGYQGARNGVPPYQGWGTLPVRTTEGVLAMWRSVCLLRSRRRTFLFTAESNSNCLFILPESVCGPLTFRLHYHRSIDRSLVGLNGEICFIVNKSPRVQQPQTKQVFSLNTADSYKSKNLFQDTRW